MKFEIHSHCGGDKSLPPSLRREIEASITHITVIPARGAATKIRDAFLNSLRGLGWSSEVAVSMHSDITITSTKQEVGLCLQTGNMSRVYADLIKLQCMYLDHSLSSAAIVVPSSSVARQLGSNIAQAQRLERELEIFKRAFHVPTLVFALE